MGTRFVGKHVLVTGGARGIGAEIARQFATEGARVHVFDQNADGLETFANEMAHAGLSIGTTTVDVANETQVRDAVAAVVQQQAIDVLVNNAGIARETSFLTMSAQEWRHTLEVNLTGTFLVAQAVALAMVAAGRPGAIVNMASKNGLDGEAGYAHYNASKAGVILLTKTMALELAHLGIRVNAVCPGYVQTPLSAEIDSGEATADFVERYIPQGRVADVQDIAPAFLFLASADANFITGQCLVLDGGQLAGQKPGAAALKRLRLM